MYSNIYIFNFLKFSFAFHFQMKKNEKMIWKQNKNNGYYISPKWKNAILEISLKSFIISKLDH